MTKSRNTRRAVLISVLTMTLSLVMLIGTTFAWFTDSVSSGNNKIVAGNLDVEVTHTNNKVTNEALDAKDAKLFPVELWEPGVVSYETFTVKNAGSLAFNYTFSLNVLNFNTVMVDDKDTGKSLKDVIKLGVLDGSVEGMTREQLVAAVKAVEAEEDSVAMNFTSFSDFSFEDSMEGEKSLKEFTIVAYWEPTENDNDYNVNGGKTVNKLNGDKNELYIDIVVNVVAKQRAYEEDSFGNDYDENIYLATPNDISAYLNGEFGSMTNAKLVLQPGNYGQLVIGTPTKYEGSNTVYTCSKGNDHDDPVSFKDIDSFKAHFEDGKWHSSHYYETTIDNLTIVGQEGVTVEGLLISSGHVYQDAYNYVMDTTVGNGKGGYYLTQHLKNITFENISFTSKVNMCTSSLDTTIEDVTFNKCSFTTNGTASTNGQGLRYYNESNNGNVKNLTVKDCTFTNCFQGIYTSNISGVTITGCTFDTTGHNAIAIQSSDHGAVNHKEIFIEGNTFKNIGDRIIRFGAVDADTQITIKNNNALNSGDKDGDVIKAVSLAEGVTYNITGNNWGENTKVGNPEFQDK